VLKAVTDGGSGELVPHEGEQEAIREITELRDQGKALRAIASANIYLDTETRNRGLITPILRALARLGHPAVLLFFALSGFVLYVSFLRGRDRSYRSFLSRRVFRLYPALIVAVAGAALLHWLQSPRNCSAYDPWVASCWCHDLTVSGTLRIMSLLGLRAEDNLFNPVLWSLFIEMRFSIVFMLLAALCQRSWIVIFGVGVAAYLGGAYLLAALGYHEPFLMGDSLASTAGVTLFYLPSFILGMLVADLLHKRIGYKFWPHSNWVKTGIVAFLLVLGLAVNSDILREFVFAAIILCLSRRLVRHAAKPAAIPFPRACFLQSLSYSLADLVCDDVLAPTENRNSRGSLDRPRIVADRRPRDVFSD
jgi:peptidoglycan/LPS O-acetylase OafA/YrhL